MVGDTKKNWSIGMTKWFQYWNLVLEISWPVIGTGDWDDGMVKHGGQRLYGLTSSWDTPNHRKTIGKPQKWLVYKVKSHSNDFIRRNDGSEFSPRDWSKVRVFCGSAVHVFSWVKGGRC